MNTATLHIEGGLVELAGILDPLEWSEIFSRDQPVVLDLGAGDGGFAAAYAAAHPDRNVLAVERLLGRIRKIGRKAGQQSLDNLRGLRLESSYLLQYLIPAHSISEIHVLFPDPWPKKKHLERRLIQPAFLRSVEAALSSGGLFRFVTDHEEYFESAVPVIDAADHLRRGQIRESYPPTDFEQQFRAQGLSIHQQLWVRK